MIKPKTPDEELKYLNGTHPRLKELKPLLSTDGRLTSPLTLTITAGKSDVDLVLD